MSTRNDGLVELSADRRIAHAESRARRALERAGLDHRHPLRLLGIGGDAVTFTGGRLVVSVRQDGDVLRESELLDFVAGLSLPLQTPKVVFTDTETRVLGTTLVPGRPLLNRLPPRGTGTLLGRLLARLHSTHGVIPSAPREPFDISEWTRSLRGPSVLVERAVEEAPGTLEGELVFSHADLGAEHLLTVDGHLTGLVDWGDACLTDRAIDFSRIFRDFGPSVFEEALRAYDAVSKVDRRAVTFFARCAAQEDLEFSTSSGNVAYGDAARRSFAWLFSAQA